MRPTALELPRPEAATRRAGTAAAEAGAGTAGGSPASTTQTVEMELYLAAAFLWSFYHGAAKLLRKQKYYLLALLKGGLCPA